MATTEAARISPQAARTRQGCTAETRARGWVIDVPLACASCPSRSFERVANMSLFLSLVLVRVGWLAVGWVRWEAIQAARTLSGWSDRWSRTRASSRSASSFR